MKLTLYYRIKCSVACFNDSLFDDNIIVVCRKMSSIGAYYSRFNTFMGIGKRRN